MKHPSVKFIALTGEALRGEKMSKMSDKELYKLQAMSVCYSELDKIKIYLIILSQIDFKGMFDADNMTDNKTGVLQRIANIEHVLGEIKRSVRQA